MGSLPVVYLKSMVKRRVEGTSNPITLHTACITYITLYGLLSKLWAPGYKLYFTAPNIQGYQNGTLDLGTTHM